MWSLPVQLVASTALAAQTFVASAPQEDETPSVAEPETPVSLVPS